MTATTFAQWYDDLPTADEVHITVEQLTDWDYWDGALVDEDNGGSCFLYIARMPGMAHACNDCDGWAVREFGVPVEVDLTDDEEADELADLKALAVYP
jgi:hypothetical protein